jgi:ABC-type uncharacterized transport system permease subunit
LEFLANLLPHLLNGVSLGLLFALIALGFMLIVGVMEVINLAHGSLFALGAYVAVTLMDWNLSYALAFLLAPLVVGGVGMLLELCLRRTYGKDPLYGLLLTFGAALVLEELIRLVWGSNEKVLQVPEAFNGAVFIGGLIYAKYRFFACLAAIGLIVLLWLFLEKTPPQFWTCRRKPELSGAVMFACRTGIRCKSITNEILPHNPDQPPTGQYSVRRCADHGGPLLFADATRAGSGNQL